MLSLSPEAKETLKKVLPFLAVAVLCLGGGAALGWGLKPDVVKVEEKLKVVEVEKQVVVEKEKVVVQVVKVKDTQVVERWHREKTTSPDGTVKEVEDKNIDSVVKEKENSTEVKVVEVEKQVVVEKQVDRVIKIDPVLAQWRVGVSGGAQFLTAQLPAPVVVLGVDAERRIAGPIWVGLAGSVNAQVSAFDIRARVAIEF